MRKIDLNVRNKESEGNKEERGEEKGKWRRMRDREQGARRKVINRKERLSRRDEESAANKKEKKKVKKTKNEES